MGGKVYDRHPLVVDRDPLRQMAVEVGNLPKPPTPAELVEGFVKVLEGYGLEAIKLAAGIDLTLVAAALADAAQRVQEVINQVWTGITRIPIDAAKALEDLVDALGNIPPFNIRGVGGGATITDTLENMWSQFWAGLTGTPGGSKSVADVANAAQQVSSNADTAVQLGEWNNAILGIRNNNAFGSGMDPTGVAMFNVPGPNASGGEPPTVAATSSNVPIAFWISPDDAKRGSVMWYGKGNANITALYIDVYRINRATSTMELLHSSPDQYPQLGTNWKALRYDMAEVDRVTVAHGDVLAVAWRVTGTGTHQIAGRWGSWLPAETTQTPQRPSATRTGVGNLAFGSINYAGDIPWVALGIVTGDVAPLYYAPRNTEMSTTGAYAYEIPTWANVVECVYLGAGGGGHGGDGAVSRAGTGGEAGEWFTETLVRGVDFPAVGTTTLTGVVGAGGAGGLKEANGGNGGNTTRAAISGGKAAVWAVGGDGGTDYAYGIPTPPTPWPGNGESVSPITFGGQTYSGGLGGSSGKNGNPGGNPGAGGGGGDGGVFGAAWIGGAGGRGGAWFRARQS